MTWNNQQSAKKVNISRTHCFSLSDFHDFDKCLFKFFVGHHLEKKYELAEGTPNQALGCLLDLAIKNIHRRKSYGQPFENIRPYISLGQLEMQSHFERNGERSYYGQQVKFLTPDLVDKARNVFEQYYQQLKGQVKPSVLIKEFWERTLPGDEPTKVWGGPDGVEMGEDGVPEVVDYKYFEDLEKGKSYLDMDLMPKIYVYLASEDLLKMGYSKARFMVRLWGDARDESKSCDFDLNSMLGVEEDLKERIEKILATLDFNFCEKPYCPACKSPQRDEWVSTCKLKLGLSPKFDLG
ncbi:MAG: PD-(D/E)XK nuclease family protein [Candidatus Daviesbacteria bacterium]|nr:PD-(D/E)XK nuclease family protein [Candidatus Daviesbacteria bacterium]